MSHKYNYSLIDKKNMSKYKDYIFDYDECGISNNIGIGIESEGIPKGAVIIHKDKPKYMIRSIRLSDSLDGKEVLLELINVLLKLGKENGYKNIECRFTDAEADSITEQIFGDVGFKFLDEETLVYRIDAFTLGSLLRDGPYSVAMREGAVSIMAKNQARCLNKISNENRKLFDALCPKEEISFVTVDEDGEIQSYVIISEITDGSLYLSAMRSAKGHEEDMPGLLYMCLGKVFMNIEPDGEFYIAAANDIYINFSNSFLEPVLPIVSVQRIITASRDIE